MFSWRGQFGYEERFWMDKPTRNYIMLPAESAHKNKKTVSSSHSFLIEAKEGTCEICKTPKKFCCYYMVTLFVKTV